ncbi:MAG TPA: aminomethyltransferase beta-barrel domain-containing protein, partial [Candidatus Acidoferrales bacterium]|nr:aminomethyltransferase beta-barrel domain-containing protein [Candidatus Acidoferrales bacterium]
PVAQKPDSQEICFVPSGNYVRFIEAYLGEQGSALPEDGGEIVSTSGEVLGRHEGVHNFTVGQRKGLGIATGRPMYVVELDHDGRRVIVGNDEELRSATCEVKDCNWIAVHELREPTHAMVKIRNRHEAAAASVIPTDEASRVKVEFDAPQRAITPGQAAVFYVGDVVLGGGWIADRTLGA